LCSSQTISPHLHLLQVRTIALQGTDSALRATSAQKPLFLQRSPLAACRSKVLSVNEGTNCTEQQQHKDV
jgi:hypothetical protein